MSVELVFGYLVGAVGVFVAVLQRAKNKRFQETLKEAGERFQKGREAYMKTKADLEALQDQDLIHRETTKNLTEDLAHARYQYQQLLSKSERLRSEVDQGSDQLQRRLEHFAEENRVLMAQVKEAEQDKIAALREMSSAALEVELKYKAEVEEYRQKLESIRRQHAELQQEAKKLRQTLTEINPVDLERTKHRNRELDRLYQGMKGLRELAEERSHNLEVAARKLAAFITRKPETMAIGPLIGEALESIGDSLMKDEFATVAPGKTTKTTGPERA